MLDAGGTILLVVIPMWIEVKFDPYLSSSFIQQIDLRESSTAHLNLQKSASLLQNFELQKVKKSNYL